MRSAYFVILSRLVAVLIATVAVSACAQPPATTPAPTDDATEEATTAEASDTPSPTDTPTMTPTATATRTPTQGPALDQLMGTPNALLAAANLSGAQTEFESLTELYPQRAEPWLGLAGLALRDGDIARARDYLEQAVEAEPTSVDANRQLALLLEQVGSYEEAAAVYTQMIPLLPDDPDVLVARATAYARLGLVEQAIADLQAAEALDPYRQYAWLNVAAAAGGTRNYEAAIEIASAGLDAHPDALSLYLLRGTSRLALNDIEPAIVDFTTAIELDSLSYTAYHMRGRAYGELGETEKAIADLQQAGELGIQAGVEGINEGYEAMADAADLMAQSGQVEEAFAYLAQQVIHYGSQDALLMGYARVDYRRGSLDLALARLTGLVRDGFVPAFYWRGIMNAEKGNTTDAISDLSAYLHVRRSGAEVERARILLRELGVDPDTLVAPTATPTPITQPGDDGGD